MEYKIFKQKKTGKIDYDFVDDLSAQFGLSYMTSLFLYDKGIDSLGKAEEFLNPSEEYLYDSFLFADMEKSVERIGEALENDEKIILFSDYDCDGVTSSIIMKKTLDALGVNAEIIIPNRFTDGYGLTPESVSNIEESGASIVVTLDNGITSVEAVEILAENNIDVIITDHHNIPEMLPKAYSIINPKNEEVYPYKELCGAGVALKFAMAIIETFGIDMDIEELMIFAMIGTIADIVPLRDENRVISSLGLKYIKNTKNKGLKALIKKSRLDKDSINSGNIAFQIAPRINAVGRLKDAWKAAQLFLSDDESEIDNLSDELCSLNDERKEIEEEITIKAETYIEENNLIEKQKILFILDKSFNEGVIGVACGKIAEKYNRPTVILTQSEGLIKASCRSINGFDIFKALDSCNGFFERFGGHTAAAGFSLKEDNLEELIKQINQYALDNGIEDLLHKRVFYDAEGISSNLDIKTAREIEKFAPFGMGNARPSLILEGVKLVSVRTIGAGNAHLKFSVLHKGNYYDAIYFGGGYALQEYNFLADSFDIIFSLGINSYGGTDRLQFEIKNIDLNNVDTDMYYKSLYSYFKESLNEKKEYFLPDDSEKIDDRIESILSSAADEVVVLYSKDIYVRAVKYLKYTGRKYKISYNELSYEPGKINVLVSPISPLKSFKGKVIVLDLPSYNDLDREVYDETDVKYLGKNRQREELRYTREFFLMLYRKFKLIDNIGNDLYEFIKATEADSDISINYFTIRLALDVLSEMGILNYELKSDKIYLAFNKINGQKDINKTRIMIKLQGISL